jgi:hypothetical protein
MNFVASIVDRWSRTCFVINRCFRVDWFVANDVYTFQILSERSSQYCVSSTQTSKSSDRIINWIISTTSHYLSWIIHVAVEKMSRSESLQCREQISINFHEKIVNNLKTFVRRANRWLFRNQLYFATFMFKLSMRKRLTLIKCNRWRRLSSLN